MTTLSFQCMNLHAHVVLLSHLSIFNWNITSRSLEGFPPCEQGSGSTYLACGHAHVALVGKWPWHCICTSQDSSNELDLEWIGPVPCWANDHDIVHLQAKKFLMNFVWSESIQWLLSSSIWKISEALIMPMSKPMWSQWANDHDFEHLQAKTVPMNLIWSESDQQLLSYRVCKVRARWTDEQMDRLRTFHIPPFFLQKGWETKVYLIV